MDEQWSEATDSQSPYLQIDEHLENIGQNILNFLRLQVQWQEEKLENSYSSNIGSIFTQRNEIKRSLREIYEHDEKVNQ